MNLAFELERDVSPATYLWDHRLELPELVGSRAVQAAIETGIALEDFQLGRARRSWSLVVLAAQEAGRQARKDGLTPRRMMADIDRVRDAVETVLFDGRLPCDLAARAARSAAKMCARAMEHALRAYWNGDLREVAAD